MKRKIYESIGNRARLSIPVKINDRSRYIEFSNGGLTSSGAARYMTCDNKLQEALESSPLFGKMFRLRNVYEIAPQPEQVQPEQVQCAQEPVPEQEEQVLTFRNFNELRDYLITEHGCSMAEVRSMELAKTAAAKLKINVEISR